jgi:hypothetical protein
MRRITTFAGRKIPCPIGQVFHKQYRENMAKTMAKVHIAISDLPSSLYRDESSQNRVLGDWFRAQNVTNVPSILAAITVSNGTGIAEYAREVRLQHLMSVK